MKIRNLIGAAVIVASGIVMTAPAFADGEISCPKGTRRSDAKVSTYAECNLDPDEDNKGLIDSVNNIINAIIATLGIVAVAVIVLGGVNYTTSAGDPGKTKKAKDTILYGIIGLVVAILAFAIVNYVLSSVFSANSSGGSGNATTTSEAPAATQ